MNRRIIATLIFAIFGALTVLAMTGLELFTLTGGHAQQSSFVPSAKIITFATASAALCGTVAGHFVMEFRWLGAMISGALLMLLAQIPFSVTLILTAMLESRHEFEILKFMLLSLVTIFWGWSLAGLYQIATGAIAGLILCALFKKPNRVLADHKIWYCPAKECSNNPGERDDQH